MAEIRICHLCQRVIIGEAVATPKFSDAGAGPNLYRHPKCVPGWVGRPARHGIGRRD